MRTLVLALIALSLASAAPASVGELQPGQFERVLLPVTTYELRGAYGSVWSTELWPFAEPGSDGYFEPFFPACNPPCEDFNERNELWSVPVGNTYQTGIVVTKPGETPGGFLYVPTDNLGHLQFSLRLTELTGIAQTIQLPVVRQRSFTDRAVRILGVPSRSFHRSTLRVYGSDPDVPGVVRVRVYTEPDQRLISEGTYALVATQRTYLTKFRQPIATKPPAAEIGNVTTDVDKPTASVEIVPLTPNLRIWAFISVTDNRTQEVVLRTPDGL